MGDGEPPAKRVKRAPLSDGSFQIAKPADYVLPNVPPTAFQMPAQLASFSYSPRRELLLSDEHKNDALAWYREPVLGVDLNMGFRDAVWRDELVDESLDALLDWSETFPSSSLFPVFES